MKKITTVVVDDNAVLLHSIANLLRSWQRFDVVGTVTNGHDAIAAVHEHEPQFVLVDATLPDTNGFELTKLLKRLGTPPRVVVLTGAESPSYSAHANAAGADGCVSVQRFTENLPPLVDRLFELA